MSCSTELCRSKNPKKKIMNLQFWCRVVATLFVVVFTQQQAYSLNTDGILLLSFKFSLLSDPLRVLQSWNYEDETPCAWIGVSCTQKGSAGSVEAFRVIGLSLPNSQLVGPISPDIGSINHLQHLDLSGNLFNGSLPVALFDASELQVLSLSNNALSGELPEVIGDLKDLQFLNLSNNAFVGSVPEKLTNIANISTISVSSNLLDGSLPPLSSVNGNLQYLNLSHNRFTGAIPAAFAKGVLDNSTIDISFNNLTGAIPQSVELMNQKMEMFGGNPGLCGKPLLNLCTIPSTLSTPPNQTPPSSSSLTKPAIAAIPTITTNSNPNANSQGTLIPIQQQTHSGPKPSTITAIAVGILAGSGILTIIALYVYQLRKRNLNSIKFSEFKKPENTYISNNNNNNNNPPNPGNQSFTTTSPEPNNLSFFSCLPLKTIKETSPYTSNSSSSDEESQNQHNQYQQHNQTKTEIYTNLPENSASKRGSLVIVDGETVLELETLLKASAYVLGTSGTTIMYKAVLDNGTAFAVRRIGEKCVEKLKDFEHQVRIVAKLKHPNLVRVRGFYWGLNEKLIISDFVNNGSLACAGKLGSSPYHLHLKMRLKIIRGVAKGLAYIHEKKHVHGNIKPSNILLSSDMEPLISDLGLDRLVHTSNMSEAERSNQQYGGSSDNLQELAVANSNPYIVIGGSSMGTTNPYGAPESLKNGKQNPKWDVYSFGIVLLELLTGKAYLDREMAQWTGSSVEDKNRVLRLADVAIRGEVEEMKDAMLACFKLGFSCVSLVPHKRPSMKEAFHVLEKVSLLST